jgi:acetyl esterase/lipase
MRASKITVWMCGLGFLAAPLRLPAEWEIPATRAPKQLIPTTITRHADLEYARPGGKSLLLDLYLPKNTTNATPVIVWIHGGAWDSGDKVPCPILKMGRLGYAIASINYRLSSVAPFPAQIHDCKAAIRWLRANADRYGLEANRIGVFGASAGGHLAALLGATANVPELEGDANPGYSSQVQAVCVLYPPTDLSQLSASPDFLTATNNPVATLLGGPINQRQALADLANPIKHASRDDAPFFILHGKRDKTVPEMQSILLYSALTKAGVRADFRSLNGGHGAWPSTTIASEINYFFNRNLQSLHAKPPWTMGQ